MSVVPEEAKLTEDLLIAAMCDEPKARTLIVGSRAKLRALRICSGMALFGALRLVESDRLHPDRWELSIV